MSFELQCYRFHHSFTRLFDWTGWYGHSTVEVDFLGNVIIHLQLLFFQCAFYLRLSHEMLCAFIKIKTNQRYDSISDLPFLTSTELDALRDDIREMLEDRIVFNIVDAIKEYANQHTDGPSFLTRRDWTSVPPHSHDFDFPPIHRTQQELPSKKSIKTRLIRIEEQV